MKKHLLIFAALTISITPVISQTANDLPKSNPLNYLLLLIMIAIIIFLIRVVTDWVKKQKYKNLKTINWFLIVANLLVGISPFLTLYSEGVQRLGNHMTVRILNDKGPGEILILLTVLNILFALLRKRIPTIILTVLVIFLVTILINTIIEDSHYFHFFGFGAGFYVLITGIILMVASYPISNVLKKEKLDNGVY